MIEQRTEFDSSSYCTFHIDHCGDQDSMIRNILLSCWVQWYMMLLYLSTYIVDNIVYDKWIYDGSYAVCG